MTSNDQDTDRSAVLELSGASAGYRSGRHAPRVLHDVSLRLAPGQTLGVVGESGSGKSTLARLVTGQLPLADGHLWFDGADVSTMRSRARRAALRRVQLIPQDPYRSLDPRMTVGRILAEAIRPGGNLAGVPRAKIDRLLELVALEPDAAGRLPYEFSGGQRQRIAIARALGAEPDVIIADEVTSALDASVEAEILNLLARLQTSTGLAMMFITHDLTVARFMSDAVLVLYLGRVVEAGDPDRLVSPRHPYTELLRDSVPDGTEKLFTAQPEHVSVEAGDPADPPSGCAFHPRCRYGPMADPSRTVCRDAVPGLRSDDRDGGAAACHFPLERVTIQLGTRPITPITEESAD